MVGYGSWWLEWFEVFLLWFVRKNYFPNELDLIERNFVLRSGWLIEFKYSVKEQKRNGFDGKTFVPRTHTVYAVGRVNVLNTLVIALSKNKGVSLPLFCKQCKYPLLDTSYGGNDLQSSLIFLVFCSGEAGKSGKERSSPSSESGCVSKLSVEVDRLWSRSCWYFNVYDKSTWEISSSSCTASSTSSKVSRSSISCSSRRLLFGPMIPKWTTAWKSTTLIHATMDNGISIMFLGCSVVKSGR